MRTVKVLLLDGVPECLPELDMFNVKLDIIPEILLGAHDLYSPPPELCEFVRRVTSINLVDLVVIGNNLGAGLVKAQAVAEDMKPKTIVTWNTYRKGEERLYLAHGLRHFCSRIDLPLKVPEVLGLR